jgi:hypothetical protein
VSEHTPEPWVNNAGRIETPGKPGQRVYIADLHQHVDEYLENARRIAACVNACAGLSTEALEAGALADALAALSGALSVLQGMNWGNPRRNVYTLAREALTKLGAKP